MNLTGPVKSVRVEEQVYEFETHFIYEHKEPLLKERFEFDREGRKVEEYTFTIYGHESPKTVSIYNDKGWLVRQDTYSALTEKPYLETRYEYDQSGNVLRAAQYSLDNGELLQKWDFKQDSGRNYFEFTDIDSRNEVRGRIGFTKDARCRIFEIVAFAKDGKATAKTALTFDDRNNPITTTTQSTSGEIMEKRKAEYEFDKSGNWTKKSDFVWKEGDGKADWKLMNVVYRNIEYYDTK